MKQHIEIEQWNELDAAGKQKIREWSKTHSNGRLPHLVYGKKLHDDSDSFTIHSSTRREDLASSYAVLLTIGQMIELLGEDRVKNVLTEEYPGYEFNELRWIEWEDKELCDALWEAVKEVLRGV